MAKLYFYYSTMNAGKTTHLLQSAYNYHERGMRTLHAHAATRRPARCRDGQVADRPRGARADVSSPEMICAPWPVRIATRQGPLHCVLVDEAAVSDTGQVWQLTDIVDALVHSSVALWPAHGFSW